MLIGSLVTGLFLYHPSSKEQAPQQSYFKTLYVYKTMIKRDDILLNTFMDGSWNRDCKYRVVPGIMLADGSIRSSIIQECGGDE
jgi:hypothetical protein